MAAITIQDIIKDPNGTFPTSGTISISLSDWMIDSAGAIRMPKVETATVSAIDGTFSLTLESTTDSSPAGRTYSASFAGTIEGVAVSINLGSFSLAPTPTTQELSALLLVGAIAGDGLTIDTLTISGTEPRLKFEETDQAGDEKLWDVDLQAKTLKLRTRTDADGAGVDLMTIVRGTGTAFSSWTFNQTVTLTTPILGTPTSGTLTNCTGLPIATGVSGLGTGVATFLATPSSANLAAALTDETGSGANVFATSPTLVTPLLGTPTSGTLTNCTGLPVSTGISGLGTGVATFLGTPSSANLASAITDETGSGLLVFATAPVFPTTITVGAAGGATGQILLKGTTSGTVTIKTADAAGTYTLTLPTNDGDASQVLTTDGAGVLSWTTASSGITGTLTSGRVVIATGTSTVSDDADFTFLTDRLTVTNLTVSGVGPHGIGVAADNDYQIKQAGSFTGAASTIGWGLVGTLTGAANNVVYGLNIAPTFVEAGSGTHGAIIGVRIAPGTITAGAANVTDVVGLDVTAITAQTTTTTASGIRVAVPTGATTNWAVNVLSGASFFGGNIVLDNTIWLQAKDSGGTIQDLIRITSGNAINIGDSSISTIKLLSTNLTNTADSLYMNYADSRFEHVQSSRDLTTASGTQDITGFGFNPVAALFIAAVSEGLPFTFGYWEGSENWCVTTPDGGAGTTSEWTVTGNAIAYNTPGTGNGAAQTAVGSSISDGVRLTWTKTGSPTGTLDFGVLGFR